MTKCNYAKQKIQYLGVTVENTKISVTKERKEHLTNMPIPTNAKQLSSLLGICSYLSPHIDSFQITASILAPLISIHAKFELQPIHIKAIKCLYKDIDNASDLWLLNPCLPVQICTDSSMWGYSALLFQEHNNIRYPLKYHSQRFPETQVRGLHSSTKEVMAVLLTLLKHEEYLAQKIPCIVLCDLKLLTHVLLYGRCKNNSHIQRMALNLSSLNVNFKICWRSNQTPEINCCDYGSRMPYTHLKAYYSKYSTAYQSLDEALKEEYELPVSWTNPDTVITYEEFHKYMDSLYQKIAIERTQRKEQNAKVNAPPPEAIFKKDLEPQHGLPEDLEDTMSHHEKRNFGHGRLQSTYGTPAFSYMHDEVNCITTIVQNTMQRVEKDRKLLTKQSDTADTTHMHSITEEDQNYTNLNQISTETIRKEQRKSYGMIIDQLTSEDPKNIPKAIKKRYCMINDLLGYKTSGSPKPKIMLNFKLALNVLALLHVLTHAAPHNLIKSFNINYHCDNKGMIAELIASNCRPCMLSRVP